jgi:hypothetical protein
MLARLAGASVTRDHALDPCEPSYVPEAARPFFIHMVHSSLGAVGVRGSTGAHLSKEVWFGAAGHVAAPELTSTGRCGLKL